MIIGILIRWLFEVFSSSNRAGRKVKYVNGLFMNNYVDARVLFMTRFKRLANITFIRDIDASKAYAMIMDRFASEITEVYQHSSFDYGENKALFNMTIFVLTGNRIVEVGCDYAEVFFTSDQYNWATGLLADLSSCRMAERTKVMGFVRPEVISEN
jgi:hypothetical protein